MTFRNSARARWNEVEAADALQMIRVTGTETNWISKFPKRWRGMYTGGGGRKDWNEKFSKMVVFFYGTTWRGGKGDEGKGQGDGWSFLGPTDQEIGNIKSCESKNVG